MRSRTAARGQAGSVLALVPAGFLVLILLGALAVDSAVAYTGQQQLHDALSAAANDAVGAGVDNGAFYATGRLALDPAAVGRTVCAAMAAQEDRGLHGVRLAVAIDGVSVRVIGSASVDAVFGRAIPGFGRRTVRSAADATLAGGAVVVGGPVSAPPIAITCG